MAKEYCWNWFVKYVVLFENKTKYFLSKILKHQLYGVKHQEFFRFFSEASYHECLLLKCLKKHSATTYHLNVLKWLTHAFDTFVVLSLWTRNNYEKGHFTPRQDFTLRKKGGLSNCQWLLDNKCQSVWFLTVKKLWLILSYFINLRIRKYLVSIFLVSALETWRYIYM
jgi:hypothetical protein